MKAVQTQQVKEAGEDEILQASGEAGNILDVCFLCVLVHVYMPDVDQLARKVN